MMGGTVAVEQEGPTVQREPEVDPKAEEKLSASRAGLMEQIREMRPRFAAVFEGMTFRGETISVHVPTPDLEEEILRSKTELLTCFKEISGVEGLLQLEVILDEELKPNTPIRLEDRQAWLVEQNPTLHELKKLLQLEAES
jgi:DNA polymerase-3 subunit gamma/tau